MQKISYVYAAKKRTKKLIHILFAFSFFPIWMGLTIPISLSIVFTLLKPMVMKDTTGLSMLAIALLVALLDAFIGIKVFEKKIQPWLEKRKRKGYFN